MYEQRISAIYADLPQGFVLQEGDIQAKATGLPSGALREAIVNALMHRSYRVNRPTQIIRYDNRLEIINAGYSLKPEDELGQPGSQPRNPLLADIFHELNLAEEKGTGIRRMQKLMQDAHLAAPTFESNRAANTFTARFLLHHFLGDEDLAWLARYKSFRLDDNQQKALVFLRETGAVDNTVFRQLSGMDTLRASADLRKMRQKGLISPKGKGTATYYVPGPKWISPEREVQEGRPSMVNNAPGMVNKGPGMADKRHGMANNVESMANNGTDMANNEAWRQIAGTMKKRMPRKDLLEKIVQLCAVAPLERGMLAKLLGRQDRYVRGFLTELFKTGRIARTIPEMPRHPRQAYIAATTPPRDGEKGECP